MVDVYMKEQGEAIKGVQGEVIFEDDNNFRIHTSDITFSKEEYYYKIKL
ncbi:MAG: hypothetical protein AAF348_19160 [Bacteroidota bacterium]